MNPYSKKITPGLQMIQSKGTTVLIAENEEEEALLAKEIANTIINKVNRLSKTNDISISDKEERNTTTLQYCCEKFLDFKSQVSTPKVMMKYNQAVEYLYIYFEAKYKIENIDVPRGNDFRTFLLQVPSRWKSIEELKNKNLRILIETKIKEKNDNKSKKISTELLSKYPVQNLKTVDEVIVKAKTIFAYFVENGLIKKNPFLSMKKLGSKLATTKREFKASELSSIFKYLTTQNKIEEYNYMKFYLMTGLRRGEGLLLKVSDFDHKTGYIDLNIVGKSIYAKRIVIIHKYLKETLLEQMKNKNDNDYLFFNSKEYTTTTRDEKVGTEINDYIKTVVGKELKKYLDIHSFRKNYSQALFLSDEFKELDYKTMIGHSTSNDVTDKHYIRGKRDYKKLQEKLNKVDFSEYFA